MAPAKSLIVTTWHGSLIGGLLTPLILLSTLSPNASAELRRSGLRVNLPPTDAMGYLD